MLYAPFTWSAHDKDMYFPSVHKLAQQQQSGTPELVVLLAQANAMQASSPTARAQLLIESAQVPTSEAAQRLAIFALLGTSTAVLHRCAKFACPPTFFSVGQPE